MEDGQQQSCPAAKPAVEVSSLFFRFNPESVDILRGVNLELARGSRCLLIGANGAGKSTLLQILAGKRMTKSKARVLGEDVFFNTPPGVAYLGTEWASNTVVRSDLVVSHFLDSVGGYRHKSRRDRLLDILDVDLDWHMHQISDGERRRVQIVQGLMAPWNLLLLDEVTVDLDVMVRQELLQFLIEDTKTRDCTVVYATHIFDGLDNFPTHVCHLQVGSTTTPKPIPWPITADSAPRNYPGVPPEAIAQIMSPDRIGSKLLVLALHWLKEDRRVRLNLEAQGDPAFKKRGARSESLVPSDSEVFYRKYDYSNSA